jgi:hypothetical protein
MAWNEEKLVPLDALRAAELAGTLDVADSVAHDTWWSARDFHRRTFVRRHFWRIL